MGLWDNDTSVANAAVVDGEPDVESVTSSTAPVSPYAGGDKIVYHKLLEHFMVRPRVDARLVQLTQELNERIHVVAQVGVRAFESLEYWQTWFANLRELEAKIRTVARFPELFRKRVIGVGGQASAGKSHFINALLHGSTLLPSDTTFTTSVPTFITKGNTTRVSCWTILDRVLCLPDHALHAIRHVYDGDATPGVSEFIREIHIVSDAFDYGNLCLLDTPGYNKPDDLSGHQGLDGDVSSRYLRRADAVIWLVDCEKGAIPRTDLMFLQKNLTSEQPVLVVFNKVEKKDPQHVANIVEQARQSLKSTHLKCADVIAFSAFRPTQFEAAKLTQFLKEQDSLTVPEWSRCCESALYPLLSSYRTQSLEQQYLKEQLATVKVELEKLFLDISDAQQAIQEVSASLRVVEQETQQIAPVCQALQRIVEKIEDHIQAIDDWRKRTNASYAVLMRQLQDVLEKIEGCCHEMRHDVSVMKFSIPLQERVDTVSVQVCGRKTWQWWIPRQVLTEVPHIVVDKAQSLDVLTDSVEDHRRALRLVQLKMVAIRFSPEVESDPGESHPQVVSDLADTVNRVIAERNRWLTSKINEAIECLLAEIRRVFDTCPGNEFRDGETDLLKASLNGIVDKHSDSIKRVVDEFAAGLQIEIEFALARALSNY